MYLWPRLFNSHILSYNHRTDIACERSRQRVRLLSVYSHHRYALKYLENSLFAVPVGYTLPASRTHGYVNSHTAALTCLHVTVLCYVVCYTKLFKICLAYFSSHFLSITCLISFDLSTMYCIVKGTNLLIKLIIIVLFQILSSVFKIC